MDLLRDRFSLRAYDPLRPVDDKTLAGIFEKARMAPSAANRQPWKLIHIKSPQVLAEVKKAYPREWITKVPSIVVVAGCRDLAWVRGADQWNAMETDLSILMTYLTLAAEEAGVGTCWIANYDPEILSAALNLEKGWEPFALTPLGYAQGAAVVEKQRKNLSEILEER